MDTSVWRILLSLVTVVVGIVGIVVLGVVVWRGTWRSWLDSANLFAGFGFGVPWFSLTAVVGLLAILVRRTSAIDSDIAYILVTALSAIALCASIFRWPRWALPPWYRAMIKNGQIDGVDHRWWFPNLEAPTQTSKPSEYRIRPQMRKGKSRKRRD
jgi:hypothetical protein